MTTKRTLYRLEAATQTEPENLLPHLVRILGRIDGTSFPVRCSDYRLYNTEALNARDCLREGVTFTVTGDADAGWKRAERIRTALVAQGWVELQPGAKVKLTLLGDTIARIAVSLPSLLSDQPRAAFRLLSLLPEDRPGGWIAESTLFGITSTDSRDYQAAGEIMLPLVVHGLIEVRSSTIARIFYRSVATELPTIEPVEIEHSERLLDIYTTEYVQAIRERSTKQRIDAAEITIPLSATT